MSFSNTYRKLGRLGAVGLAAFAFAAPAAYGAFPDGDGRFTLTTVEVASGYTRPDDRPVRPSGPVATTPRLTPGGDDWPTSPVETSGPFVSGVPGGGYVPAAASPEGDAWPYDSFGAPDAAPTAIPVFAIPVFTPNPTPHQGIDGFYNSPIEPAPLVPAAPEAAPAPVDVVQPVSDTGGADWRTISIALSATLAALLAAMAGIGIVRRSHRQHAQLS
jgi:hypothetical protein